jgi:aldehyde dehydrogenase (NAD+)
METLRIGDPLDKAVDIGAIIAPVQLEKIRGLVQQGIAEGATCWQPSWSVPKEGYFFPPTLFTDVTPTATVAQVEIFGPVVVLMTFRTPAEAVELANNTRYGLAASVWSENLNTALDIAPQLKAGTVWVNCTNMFDAASGFGGYRESGFGREGGREGLWEYVKRTGAPSTYARPPVSTGAPAYAAYESHAPSLDRTPKLYIAGKQVRPDSGYALPVLDAAGNRVAEVGHGNRKDIRNAVEAAHKAAEGWAKATAHARAQIIYYFAENLAARESEFAARLCALCACPPDFAEREVRACVQRAFSYAAWADKYDGRVHATPYRNVTLAMNEPIGVLGLVAPTEAPLLGFLSLVLPTVAMGNTVVAVPSERWPLLATDLYQVFDTSDVPGGVINLVTGPRKDLAPALAAHDDVDGIWFYGPRDEAAAVEKLSAGNMKRTHVAWDPVDWLDPYHGEGEEFLREATQVKNIWVPYGA